MLVEPRYVDGENESVPIGRGKECGASKLRWENIEKETWLMVRFTPRKGINEE